VTSGLTLKHLADEDELAAFILVGDAVADHSLPQHRGEFRREVADLIGVREENEIRLRGLDDLLERDAVAVGRVVFEQVVLDEQNFSNVFGGEFVSEGRDTFANDERGDGAAGVFRDVLRRCECFEAGVVPLVLALLGDDEDFHC
jgi:hypothetical protein